MLVFGFLMKIAMEILPSFSCCKVFWASPGREAGTADPNGPKRESTSCSAIKAGRRMKRCSK